MKAHRVIGPTASVGCNRLSVVKFNYLDFDSRAHDDGQIVVMDAAAKRVLAIFGTLFNRHFPIAKAKLMNSYEGDDDASMADNNTSGFNDRKITGGNSVSLHAYGLAIDINPVQNPYVVRSGAALVFQPSAGLDYANRLNDRPWKDARRGMAEAILDVFAENGFLTWGGYWDNPIDYQHFQVGLETAKRLAAAAPAEAEGAFNGIVQRYRDCRNSRQSVRSECIMLADPTAGSAKKTPADFATTRLNGIRSR
jgi:hypothetical protein